MAHNATDLEETFHELEAALFRIWENAPEGTRPSYTEFYYSDNIYGSIQRLRASVTKGLYASTTN